MKNKNIKNYNVQKYYKLKNLYNLGIIFKITMILNENFYIEIQYEIYKSYLTK